MNKNNRISRIYTTLIASLLTAFVSFSSAMAEDGSSGCGLGWKVAPKQSLISSTTRTYINVTSSNTSGMTSGTSGCATHSIVKNDKKAIHYAEVNLGQLMIDMAQGQGEHLRGLAATLGCSSAGAAALGHATQADYSRIFPSSATSPAEMLEGVRATISRDRALALQCGFSVT